jgi:hypothetical protein
VYVVEKGENVMRCECGKRIGIDFAWEMYEAIPVAFHPYTSYVQERIITIKDNPDFYKEMEDFFLEKFKNAEIKVWPDNKIVFECNLYGKTICFGFYDWDFSIGFSYYDEHEERRSR